MLIDRGDLGKIERALEHEPILANAGNSDESALRLHREAKMSIKRNHREGADAFEALALGAIEEGYAMPSQALRSNADAALLSRLDALHLSLAS